MTDTAGLIAQLNLHANRGDGPVGDWPECCDAPEWTCCSKELLRNAAAALAAQAQEIERLTGLYNGAVHNRNYYADERKKERERAETAEAEVKRITQMAIGEIYAEWGHRVEAAEARVRELQTVAFQAQEMAKEQCSRADAIESQTIERTAERVDKLGEHSIARAIRALNPSSVSS